MFNIKAMSRSLPPSLKPSVILVAAIFALSGSVWLCWQLGLFLGGAQSTAPSAITTSTVFLGGAHRDDQGLLDSAAAGLYELGWPPANTRFIGVQVSAKCGSNFDVDATQTFFFWRHDRLGLLTSHVYYASVAFSRDATEMTLAIQDYGLRNEFGRPGIAFDDVAIDSTAALALAEVSGGQELRNQATDSCTVTAGLSRNNVWQVDYLQQEGYGRLLCFDIDAVTGVIEKRFTRNALPCQPG